MNSSANPEWKLELQKGGKQDGNADGYRDRDETIDDG
jgi:hypothetical protein